MRVQNRRLACSNRQVPRLFQGVFGSEGKLMKIRHVTAVLVIYITILGALFTGAQTKRKDHEAANIVTAEATCMPRTRLSSEDFDSVLGAIQKAWVAGEAEKAASCFAPAAIFSLPPSPPVIGRESLLRVFGAGNKSGTPQSIEWHHIVFDPAQQVGAAEFTIQRHIPTHGVVFVRFSGGLISNWRQYSIASDLTWNQFVGANSF
jgi:SnoaL-like domain